MPFLQPDHRPSIKHPQGHPVEVIASYKPSGELKPMYFRIEDDRQERFTFMLSYAHLRKAFNYIETYACEYEAYGRRNSIVLLFDVTQCRWTVG
jgi:hypothetical protein